MSFIPTLHALFLHELKDLYDAEHQITEALPAMADAAAHKELKEAFMTHLQQTEKHIERLEQVFEVLGEKPERQRCDGMGGLIKEANKLFSEDIDANVLDIALIAAANKVEHYEIAGYGTVCEFARMMGHTEAENILKQTLDEEGETNRLLTKMAEHTINLDAPMGHDREMAK